MTRLLIIFLVVLVLLFIVILYFSSKKKKKQAERRELQRQKVEASQKKNRTNTTSPATESSEATEKKESPVEKTLEPQTKNTSQETIVYTPPNDTLDDLEPEVAPKKEIVVEGADEPTLTKFAPIFYDGTQPYMELHNFDPSSLEQSNSFKKEFYVGRVIVNEEISYVIKGIQEVMEEDHLVTKRIFLRRE